MILLTVILALLFGTWVVVGLPFLGYLLVDFLRGNGESYVYFAGALMIWLAGGYLPIAFLLKIHQGDSFKESLKKYLKALRIGLIAVLQLAWCLVGAYTVIYVPVLIKHVIDYGNSKAHGTMLVVDLIVMALWVLITLFGHKAIKRAVVGNIDPDSAVGRDTYYDKDIRTIVAAVDRCTISGAACIKGKNGNVYSVNVAFAGFYDEDKGELIPERGNLHWYVKRFIGSNCGRVKGFDGNGLYRVRVREQRFKDTSPFADMDKLKKYHRLWLESVVDKNAVCPELQAYWEEYSKPVIIKDELFGELVLDRIEERFEGKPEFGVHDVDIYISAECEPEKWEERIRNAAQLVGDFAQFDDKCREYILQELYENADEWNDEPISRESFLERLGCFFIIDISNENYKVYYDSDGMFTDHCIVVRGSFGKGLEEAFLEG